MAPMKKPMTKHMPMKASGTPKQGAGKKITPTKPIKMTSKNKGW
jgi:hypothetical protein